jgi:Holliday junction DNA helicase RuvA
MISQICGLIFDLNSQQIFINIGPVVLQIWVPDSGSYTIGSQVTVHIEMIWKDTGPTLYGFDRKEDIALFHSLMTIPSVGPKLALSIMRYPRHLFITACQSQNASALCSISGVGKKTALRIVSEIDLSILSLDISLPSQLKSQARLALIALGFQERMIDDVVKEYQGDSLETCIKESLLKLGERRVTSGQRSRTTT